ncbi:MAG: restriction endonuclease subunit S [Thermoguttaceae bacterium]
MKNWKTVKLGDHVDIFTGFPFKSKEFCDEPGIRLARGDNVKRGEFDWGKDKTRYWQDATPNLEPYQLRDGDVLIGMDGSRIGENWVVVSHFDLPCLLVQRVARLRSKCTAYQQFLRYIISSQPFCRYIKAIQTGTSIPHISAKQIAGFEFPLPPLPEQRRIAGILGCLDAKIELNRRMSANLEAQAAAIFKNWFVDCKSAHQQSLSEIIEINPSRSLAKGETARYVEMSNVSNTLHQPTNWRLRPFGSGTKFTNGDTLLARITPCLENGKAAYVDFLEPDEIAWGSTEFIIMRPKINVHPFWCYLLARHDDFLQFAIRSMTGSSGRQRVQNDVLLNYLIGQPAQSKLDDFSETIQPIAECLKINALQSRVLASLRDTLLPRLMSGEV